MLEKTIFARPTIRRLTRLAAAGVLLTLAACSPRTDAQSKRAPAPVAIALVKTEAPAGAYKLDPAHTSVIFRVNHIGMSHYTRRFTAMKGELDFDPAHPEASRVTAAIDPGSIETDYPDPKLDFNAQLRGPEFLNVARFPTITFRSTRVALTGANTARITGDLSLHGVTRPVVLNARFNGGYAPNAMDPMGARIGFSAQGVLKRAEFGMGYGVPPAGSTMGVSDEVEVLIETEFTKPGPKPAP